MGVVAKRWVAVMCSALALVPVPPARSAASLTTQEMFALADRSVALAPSPLLAKGCIRGAVTGAVAGHYARHHAVMGAMAGCAAGHYYYKNKTTVRQKTTVPATSH